MSHFDPNQPGDSSKIFGLPYSPEESEIVLLPVPWDLTVSYGAGAVNGPEAIQKASVQLDYSVPGIDSPWKLPMAMLPINEKWKEDSNQLRSKVEKYLSWLENSNSEDVNPFLDTIEEVNKVTSAMVKEVFATANHYLDQGKVVGVVGGDHSTPLGLLKALSQYHEFGILQIDAHMDLRKAYEGFIHSHASIMFNALESKSITKLVQVGIRDYCEEETAYMRNSNGRILTYFDQKLKQKHFEGQSKSSIYQEIISHLPKQVYISFDIDGLDPKLCPHTGTPVPGGLEFYEVIYLIEQLVVSGRQIIGFDLSEVCPGKDEWDGNVGARILFNLCAQTGVSMGKLKQQ